MVAPELLFNSRRSTVYSTKGCVASSQPLATEAGVALLKQGANAADAAIGVAAALNILEPCSTGIGGDMFCLYYDAASKSVKGLNGSGRAPEKLDLAYLRKQGITGTEIPLDNLNTVTVPGACAGWFSVFNEWGSGKFAMAQLLAPAIGLGEEGFPVSELAAAQWKASEALLQRQGADALLPNGKAPVAGQKMRNPDLAKTFRTIAAEGPDGFYKGRIADAIVKLVSAGGGLLSKEDLAAHKTDMIKPIKLRFQGVDVHQCPPNGQGLTALVALGIIEAYADLHKKPSIVDMNHNSTEYLHLLIEALRLAFADTRYFVADPDTNPSPVDQLLDRKYLKSRAALIDATKASDVEHGSPANSSETCYFTVTDNDGNACSFIISNYAGFGTGAIPNGCGFTLQNRGNNFNLLEGHPNCIAPRKRPYHTIMPGMITHPDGELMMAFGVMGAFNQPQGQIQVLINMLKGMSAQAALDAGRFCIDADVVENAAADEDEGPLHLASDLRKPSRISRRVDVEDAVPQKVREELAAMGHQLRTLSSYGREKCGRGQIIQMLPQADGSHVWAAGSDPRADGCAMAAM